jgi:hypothetical protein
MSPIHQYVEIWGLAIAVEKEENHEKGPRCSQARNQMGNIK